MAVAGPKPPLPRPSSERSTVPSATALAAVPVGLVDSVESPTEATADSGTDVGVVVAVSTVEVVVEVSELAAAAATVVDELAAGFGVVGAAPLCEATSAEVAGGDSGCTGVAVITVVGGGCTTAAAVVVTGDGDPGGVPQSAALSGAGAAPSIGGGGWMPGGGMSAPVLPSTNDQPSTVPGGGTRAPGPRVL